MPHPVVLGLVDDVGPMVQLCWQGISSGVVTLVNPLEWARVLIMVISHLHSFLICLIMEAKTYEVNVWRECTCGVCIRCTKGFLVIIIWHDMYILNIRTWIIYAHVFSYVYVLGWLGRITLTSFPTERNTQSTIMSLEMKTNPPAQQTSLQPCIPPHIMMSQHLLAH